MNVLLTLEFLGYTNIDDFEIRFVDGTVNDISVWHHADPQPTQSELDAGWASYLLANPYDVAAGKANAKADIDIHAEAARLRHVTSGAGQAMAYQAKADEATDYIAAGYPADLTSYPFIQAEVNATGKNSTLAANDILLQKSAWYAIGAQIEEIRLGGKKSVDDATDENEIISARDTTIAALEVI